MLAKRLEGHRLAVLARDGEHHAPALEGLQLPLKIDEGLAPARASLDIDPL